MGRRRSAEPPRPGSIPGVGSTRWSSSEVERHVETVRVRRLKTVLQRHSRVAQRPEQLPYKQKDAGSSPCLGNHTLVAEQVGSRLLNGDIEVRVLARVPSGDSRARSKARGPDPRERRFESSSPDQRRCSSSSAELTSPKGGDKGSSPFAGAKFSLDAGCGGRSSNGQSARLWIE